MLISLALSSCERKSPRSYLSPALDVVVTDSESAFCVHRDGKVEYVLYYADSFSNWSANGSSLNIEEPHAWLERGHLDLFPSRHYIGVLREGTRPSQLFLNGRQVGLSDHVGRVFVITDSQTFNQIRLNTGVIRNEEDLRRFSEGLRVIWADKFAEASVRADEKFRDGRYRAYVAILRPYENLLSETQKNKYSIAIERSNIRRDEHLLSPKRKETRAGE